MTPQTTFDFPMSLSEKYRPLRIQDFVGLDKAKRIVSGFIATPYQSAWLFVGASGTGKTTMALALAAEIPAELHHIPARECTLEAVQDVCRRCHYSPRQPDNWQPVRFHVVLIDEADQMSNAAQLALLSKLDATAFPPNTIFIFTCNATDGLEKRFLSRCRTIEFSNYNLAERPNFQRIVKDSCNNVRDALMTLETEILAA
jgi:DNA polymerase III delta prime subunit